MICSARIPLTWRSSATAFAAGRRDTASRAWRTASAGIHFSLAHSGPDVVVAVSRAGPVGVDVECLKPKADYRRLCRRTLTADEAVAFDAGGARPLRLPAHLGAQGGGDEGGRHRHRDAHSTPSPWPRPAKLATLLTWPDDPSLVDRTTLLDLRGDPDRPAAVAVLERDVRITEHDGSPVLRAAARE